MTDARLAELMSAITALQVKTPVAHPASRVLKDFFEVCHEFRKALVNHEEELAQAAIKEREECIKIATAAPTGRIAASNIRKIRGVSFGSA